MATYTEDEVQLVDNSTAIEALNRSEIDVQISTARAYPRSIRTFRTQAMEMATLDEDTAASMFYTVPRAGKRIKGPSVRFAEVVGSCYGNLRYGSRVVSIDDKFVTAQGACHDLEKNVAIHYEVKRRITNSEGKRYNDDMIQTTGNAACAIALREAIFKIVPRSLCKDAYEQAMETSVGKAKSMSEKRQYAIGWLNKMGASEAQVLAFLDRKGIEEITNDDLIDLKGVMTAVRDGEITIEKALTPETPAEPKSKVKTSPLNDKLGSKDKKPTGAPSDDESHHGDAPRQPASDPTNFDYESFQADLSDLHDAAEVRAAGENAIKQGADPILIEKYVSRASRGERSNPKK